MMTRLLSQGLGSNGFTSPQSAPTHLAVIVVLELRTLSAFFRRQILQAIAHVRRFLSVDFTFHVDLPQTRFDRCGLRLRAECSAKG